MRILTLLMLLFVSTANATVYTTTAADTWDGNGAPAGGWITGHTININHSMTQAYSLQLLNTITVNINSGGTWNITDITTSGTTFVINVNSGGTLNLTSTMSLTGGTVTVSSGGAFVTGGSTSNVAGTTMTINGYLEIGSAFTNNASITGTGEISYSSLGGAGSIAGTISLPVELIHFSTAKKGENNSLKWITASEINNDYFEVQTSVYGINFNTIGTVFGAGNSSEVLTYTFTDNNSSTSSVYYRLKQVDYDGVFTYSNVIFTGSQNKAFASIVQANTSKEFTILSHDQGSIQVNVYSFNGSLLNSMNFEGKEGDRFNFTTTTTGGVMIQVSNGTSLVSKKSIIR